MGLPAAANSSERDRMWPKKVAARRQLLMRDLDYAANMFARADHMACAVSREAT